MRSPRISVRTPVLSHDGCDLAAALQTIMEIGDGPALHAAIASALPGRRLTILSNDPESRNASTRYTELQVGFETEGCDRTITARELSDGTLKFLCLVACLLSPRPLALIALNEPESGLHHDLLDPLAKLIVSAGHMSQVWVSTHSPQLANRIQSLSSIKTIKLILSNGETVIESDEDSSDEEIS